MTHFLGRLAQSLLFVATLLLSNQPSSEIQTSIFVNALEAYVIEDDEEDEGFACCGMECCKDNNL